MSILRRAKKHPVKTGRFQNKRSTIDYFKTLKTAAKLMQEHYLIVNKKE